MFYYMFGIRDKATACGMWSPTYIIALLIVILLIGVSLFFSRKMSHRGVKKVIVGMAIFSTLTEVMKIIFIWYRYGLKDVEFLPLYFCSLFIFNTILSCFKNEKLKNTGLSFLFFGGIAGATAFFIYPSAGIPNYPIYHFMCLRTMTFHGAMIYTGVLIVMRKYYRPDIRHFVNYLVELVIIGVLAMIMNKLNGTNLMYISKPINIPIVKAVFNAVPHLYPFLALLLQILAPFWATYGVYRLIEFIKTKSAKKESE